MKLKKTIILVAATFAAVLLPGAAMADGISLSLSNPVRTVGTSGTTLSFSGTVTNTGTVTEYFNADNLSFGLAQNMYDFVDDGFFYNLFSLDPNQSYTGDLFTVALHSGVNAGSYIGTYTLLGGTGAFDLNNIASATLQVNVTAPTVAATPEPSSLLLLSTGGLGLAGMLRRRFAR